MNTVMPPIKKISEFQEMLRLGININKCKGIVGSHIVNTLTTSNTKKTLMYQCKKQRRFLF